MHKQLAAIERKIARVKEQLQGIGEMRPGSLTRQYQKPKQKKGGYYQISYTHHMKSRTEYVRADDVKQLRQEVKTFKQFRNLVQTWTDLALQHSQIKIEIAKRERNKPS